MDYSHLIKALVVTPGFVAPATLSYDDIRASMLCRGDLIDDVKGVNESLELIRRTRGGGGGWPTEPVTEAYDFVDLVWHECEFRENYSFSYAVYDDGGRYLGCCYLYPMGRRTPLDQNTVKCDVDVSWWVTPDAYERGYYDKLYVALQRWVTEAFPFRAPYYSNREMPG